MATVRIGSAHIDERGKATGGKAGDQTGKEVSAQAWYKHSKGWVLIRAKDPAKATVIAETMEAACASPLIGYDQHQRDTLWDALKNKGFDLSKLSAPVEVDCSSLVRFCCAAAGIIPSNFSTGTQVSHLRATGAFTILTASKYVNQSAYLRKGDILVTATKGHTVVVLNDGAKAYDDKVPLGTRPLAKGDSGTDVAELQDALARLGFDPQGIDGEFGPNTEQAVKDAQQALGLPVTGKADLPTITAIKDALAKLVDPEQPEPDTETGIRVTGDSVNLRSGPGEDYSIVGQAMRGDMLEPVVMDGWRPVLAGGEVRWISAQYSEVVS
jgi:hypothetical protein